MTTRLKATLLALFLSALIGAPASAAVIFSDNFDSSMSNSTLNAAVPGWTTTSGTVDYIKSGGYGINCYGSVGGCIDLDGSTSDAGIFTWGSPINFVAGNTYSLMFRVSGNQRTSGSDIVSATLGGVTLTFSVNGFDPYQSHVISWSPTTSTIGNVEFSNAGGDNVGAILDDVTLQSRNPQSDVPEPSTYALVGLGLAGASLLRRR